MWYQTGLGIPPTKYFTINARGKTIMLSQSTRRLWDSYYSFDDGKDIIWSYRSEYLSTYLVFFCISYALITYKQLRIFFKNSISAYKKF